MNTRDGKSQREEKSRREKSRREKIREEDAGARKGRKVAKHSVFPMICGAPEGRQVGSLKRRVRSHLARWEMKNCTPLWHEAHVQVKTNKTPGARSTFGSWDVEKAHAVVARSTFWSQNVQNTPGPDHFWQLRCRKSARRCGAKHISKSKCTKHTRCGPLLAVEMSKKCTPLWREAHFEVKMLKTLGVRSTFGGSDVEKVHAVVARAHFQVKMLRRQGFRPLLEVQMSFPVAGAKDCAPCQKWAKREGFVAFSTTTTTTHQYTSLQLQLHLHYIPLHYTTPHSTTFHYTTLTYNQLHSITLNYATLHYTTLHYPTLHYTPLHYTTPHYTTLHYSTLHYTILHYTTFHYTTLHFTTLQLHHTTFHYYTTLHYTPLRYTQLHYTTLHYIPLHYTTLH